MTTIADWAGNYAMADITKSFPAEPVYDGVVLSAAATEAAGISGIPSIFAAIDKALKPGGFGVFVSSVALDHSKRSDLDVSFLTSGRFGTFLEANTGWRLQGPLDLAMTAATLDSVDSEDAAEPIIRLGERGRIRASCVLVYQKEGITSASGWETYAAAFAGQPPATVAVT